MKILLVCMFLVISLISSCYCACSFDPETGTSTCVTYTQWTEGVSGAVSWAKDCDFTGHDVAKIDGPEHNCGKLCYDYSGSKCTHFTWSKGICYIKSNARRKVFIVIFNLFTKLNQHLNIDQISIGYRQKNRAKVQGIFVVMLCHAQTLYEPASDMGMLLCLVIMYLWIEFKYIYALNGIR